MTGETETIVLGGGCFWCTEAVFQMLRGVASTVSGYAGGNVPNPTYEQVCTGETGHAEVLKVEYSPSVIPLQVLLDVFMEMHDPTSLNMQGADAGTEYRSAIYYTNKEQKRIIDDFIREIQKRYTKPIVTEIRKLDKFYPAEDYHQDFYKNNRYQPYCTVVISPKVAKIRKEFSKLLK